MQCAYKHCERATFKLHLNLSVINKFISLKYDLYAIKVLHLTVILFESSSIVKLKSPPVLFL